MACSIRRRRTSHSLQVPAAYSDLWHMGPHLQWALQVERSNPGGVTRRTGTSHGRGQEDRAC